MNPKIKNIIIFVGIFILLIAGYVFFFGNKTPTPALQTTSGAPTTASVSPLGNAAVGKEFLDTLLNIRNIRLDASIFSNPSFVSLRDFDLSLIQEPNPGRKNPFLPLGVDAQSAPTPASSPSTTPAAPPASPPAGAPPVNGGGPHNP